MNDNDDFKITVNLTLGAKIFAFTLLLNLFLSTGYFLYKLWEVLFC